uniref:Uncharacterized protein n=1 Tax=Rhizophora mucronata TaxID=61149 RepID=A0A2P2IK18_RHIMU
MGHFMLVMGCFGCTKEREHVRGCIVSC